jgi:hypothetical protein
VFNRLTFIGLALLVSGTEAFGLRVTMTSNLQMTTSHSGASMGGRGTRKSNGKFSHSTLVSGASSGAVFLTTDEMSWKNQAGDKFTVPSNWTGSSGDIETTSGGFSATQAVVGGIPVVTVSMTFPQNYMFTLTYNCDRPCALGASCDWGANGYDNDEVYSNCYDPERVQGWLEANWYDGVDGGPVGRITIQ